MRIEQAQLTLNTQAVSKVEQYESTQLHFWKGDRQQVKTEGDTLPSSSMLLAGAASLPLTVDSFDISQQGLEIAYGTTATEPAPASGEVEYEVSAADQLKIQMLEQFFARMTGKKIKLGVPTRIKLIQKGAPEIPNIGAAAAAATNSAEPARQGWGLTFDATRVTNESASFTFSSTGTVKTEDGREISLNLTIQASREFIEKSSFSLRAGDATLTDPLVVSLNGRLPQLTGEQILFDLDSNGTADQISRLAEGNGYIALDINGDGQVNDGSELFGTASGDGFADLAAVGDSDNNGWIDENDPIFNQLRIWEQRDDGTSTLLALGEIGIGAIYLGHMGGAFDIKDGENNLLGRIQSSGVYLWENGLAGSAHQLDLVM